MPSKNSEPVPAEELSRAIRDVLAPQGKPADLVREYYDTGKNPRFAGDSFDSLGRPSNPDDRFRFTTEDVLSLCMLDIRPHPDAIRRLTSGELDTCLRDLPFGRPIWETTDSDRDAMSNAWSSLIILDNFGRTATSKILSRKRPELVPIRDSVIERVLGIGDRPWWKPLGDVLRDETLRASIDSLWGGPEDKKPSTLRLLDVAAWMLGSRSTHVQSIRKRVGSRGIDRARTESDGGTIPRGRDRE